MKVFTYTNGYKGELLDNVNRANSMGSWLRLEGNEVYKISLGKPKPGWTYHGSATLPVYENGKMTGDQLISPEQYDVEAICFCTGQANDGEWIWTVLVAEAALDAWIADGRLTKTFSHVKEA